MADKQRNLQISPRKEELREAVPIAPPIRFSLTEILHHFTESMDSVKAQFKVAETLAAENDITGCKTIWRSQVVLAEGLLDFYIHEMSKYCMYRMFTGQWEHSEKYNGFTVTMQKVEEAIASAESKEWFFDYLNDRFCRDVFISKEGMKDQLNMIGVDFRTVLVNAFPSDNSEQSFQYGKTVVEELFRRRNAIAHQNDRSHASAEQEDISKEYVDDYIRKIEAIVNSIHEIAEQKG